MCAEKPPSLREILANLRKPMPAVKKVRMVTENTLRKILHRKSCCGNTGQPGC